VKFRALVHDRRGATLTEFALVAPVMLLMLMGLFDLCYQSYAQSILNGAVQAAARRATLEGNSSTTTTAALDAAVVSQVRVIARNLRWDSDRKSYASFGDIRAEPFSDTNANGRYDLGECFSDANGNGVWDSDPGVTGQGGANDVTLYTINITYPRLFPLYGLMGASPEQTITARTLLKNQPYGAQAISTPATIC
jgi:Flp pilus assembly pilin Flp